MIYIIYQYRPWEIGIESRASWSYQDDNGYSKNTIYWFSFDPIEWNILTESNGQALIISNLILDSQIFNTVPELSGTQFDHNGGKGYQNDYKLSDIRKFLISTFYNTAFKSLQKLLIKNTSISDGVSSTNDKVFLLSKSDANTYYKTNSARLAKGSEYAKSQGLYVNLYTDPKGYSDWRLCSRFESSTISTSTSTAVSYTGEVSAATVYKTTYGIRPACWINLE